MQKSMTMKSDPLQFVLPDWQAPANVQALTTTRQGGFSQGIFDSLNLGDHVDDHPQRVSQNREKLLTELGLTNSQWLQQVHGVSCIAAGSASGQPIADACYTDQANMACVVMTADCLPVFFCNEQGNRVAVAHAGWRGLLDGVLESTLKVFAEDDKVMAAFGPAIGPAAFEVGSEVREQFCDCQAKAETAFIPSSNVGKYLADIYKLASLRLEQAGVKAPAAVQHCTYTDSEQFFSYRREGQTGRMASLIWFE